VTPADTAEAAGAASAWVLALLALSLAGYALGVARLWRRAGARRGLGLGQVLAFAAGWSLLAAALLSPLDAWAEQLFCAHMLQHELLMLAAAPLLVLGRPLAAWAWALPQGRSRALGAFFRTPGWQVGWQAITRPLGAWALHALALWGWHLPALFDAALHNEAVHALQHTSFLGTALLFWWSVLRPQARRRTTAGPALLSLFTTLLHTGALGALLTLAPQALYMDPRATALPWGLDPLADQQLGGLLMWVPGSIVYLGCALWLGARLLSPAQRPRGPRPAPLARPRPGAP